MNIPAGGEALLQTGWLSRQPADFQRALLDAAIWRDAAEGATVNRGGDDTGGIWGLARGQLDVTSALSAPDTPVADIYLPGQWGGIGPAFGLQRGAHGTARIPSLLALVPQARLMALVAEHPGWWQSLGALAADFAFRYGGGLGDLLIRDQRRRCIAVLLRFAGCRMRGPGADLPATIVCTQDQLAAAANMSRFPAGEVLRGLAAKGLIELGYRSITVRDAAALRALVDGG